MNAVTPETDHAHKVPPDDSDKAHVRKQFVFDGELLDDDGITVWGRLESQRAGYPRMTHDDVMKQLWTWRAWRVCRGNCRHVAYMMRKHGWPDAIERKVKYRIKTMKRKGIVTGLGRRPPAAGGLS